MRSHITIGGRLERPDFDWTRAKERTPVDQATGQLVESMRNVTEAMLVCLERIERNIARMDRRLAKHMPLRGGR